MHSLTPTRLAATVVIPALNVEDTIGGVVAAMLRANRADDVVVVNNASTDATAEVARRAGARVIPCDQIGLGAAMKAGLRAIRTPVAVKIDGDIRDPKGSWLDALITPLGHGSVYCSGQYESDYDAFPVNTLVGRPLIRTFFPELSHIHLPLSGSYAFNIHALDWNHLPDGWGFDVGILIQAFRSGKHLLQIPIGALNDRPVEIPGYERMAEEVLREVLRQASESGRLLAP